MSYCYQFPFRHTFTSKYQQRMRKLSCKIFNEFYIPELSKKEVVYGAFHPPVKAWTVKWHSDYTVFHNNQLRPNDLNDDKNDKYYPAHPQIRQLTNVLREYGLYRDEHRDFNEEMKAIAIARGKVFPLPRKLRDGGGEKKKKK